MADKKTPKSSEIKGDKTEKTSKGLTSADTTAKAAKANTRSIGKTSESKSKKSDKDETEEFIAGQRAAMTKRKEVRDEVVLILIGLLAILLYLSLFDKCGIVGRGISTVLFGLIGGILPYVFPIALFSVVFYVRRNPDDPLATRKTTVFFVAQLFLAAFIHTVSGVAEERTFFQSFKAGYQEREGGGLLGACVAEPLIGLFNKTATIIILIALLLVCIVLIVGKSIVLAVKRYMSEKKADYREANQPEFLDREETILNTSGMSLEQIQEANRRRRVKLVDADAPSGPVDLSFYGEVPVAEPPKKRPGFFDRIHKKEPEPKANPTYTAVFVDPSKSTTIPTIPEGAVVVSTTPTGTASAGAPLAGKTQQQYAPDTIGRNSRVSDSGHPFYQIELDNKFRETARSDESILKNDYDVHTPAQTPVSEREAARRAAVEKRLGNIPGTENVSQISIHGLNDNATEPEHSVSSYNPYDAVEQGEAVAPTREELHGGLRVVKGGESRQGSTETARSGETAHAASTVKPAAEPSVDNVVQAAAVAPVRAYRFPPIDLLSRPSGKGAGMTSEQLKATAAKLQTTLQSFGVNVTVTNISCGPSVTRYELTPEQGVKVSRITNLENDIKLNLAAEDIRIEAPIPGKSAVGIEVPNTEVSGVMLRTLIESQEFKTNKGKITFAVGKDIGGNIVLSDIAKMPHLLIAGATGSGKSVCINTMIISLLYKYSFEDLRFIMIDPKVVELSVYNGIPHLLIPVVTDPRKASNALNWAVAEMTRRYELFAHFGVRNLEGYNEKIAASTETLLDDKGNPARKMWQIVIIVDELADLMMVAPGEVEDAICRLAQLARAAGLHLIIATQRPAVDVITGLIKANIPSRIAFAVSSGIDSRTILDQVGAEKLLGKGDMLFFPQGIPKPVRLQGPFVSDEEIASVVAYIAGNNTADYDKKASEDIANNDVATVSEQMKGGDSAPNDGRDEFFAQAGRFIIEKDQASIGMLQRVYKIGFNRAARIMDQLSEAGVVGPEEGTKPRKILMSAAEFEAFLSEQK